MPFAFSGPIEKEDGRQRPVAMKDVEAVNGVVAVGLSHCHFWRHGRRVAEMAALRFFGRQGREGLEGS